MAKENIKSPVGLRRSIGCNLLQDAIECYLLALSEHLNAGLEPMTPFHKYFDIINKKIEPNELPFRARLLALNKLRVNSKHHGLEPSINELEQFLPTVWEFFVEATEKYFDKSYSTISLLDSLSDSEAKQLLQQAEHAFEIKNYALSLVLCRQAIFIEFEYYYDVRIFSDGKINMDQKLRQFGSSVPYFARNQEYINKNIKEPTDYIVYDHAGFDMDLLKKGIDQVTYWNVWRLTPSVYREGRKAEWIVKNDFQKLEPTGISDRAEYVLASTTEIMLNLDQYRNRSRQLSSKQFVIPVGPNGVTVYSKASKSSSIETTVSGEFKQLDCDYSIHGLDGSGIYFHVLHFDEFIHVNGFIHEQEVPLGHP
jgi:hypothetical protein